MRGLALALFVSLAACSPEQQRAEPTPTEAAASPSAKAAEPAETPDAEPPQIAGRYVPRDECAALPGWKPFAAAIRAAVAKRDAKAFAALASEDILLDFGGGAGRTELVKRLDDRKAPDLWDDLDRLLALGCASGGGARGASMPWFWEQDLDGADPFEAWLVTGDAVPLLSAGDAKAEVKARLSWVLVGPVGGYDGKSRFQQVRVVGRSEQGFVEAKYLRSQIDYRLISERIGGAWRITHLIAGD